MLSAIFVKKSTNFLNAPYCLLSLVCLSTVALENENVWTNENIE